MKEDMKEVCASVSDTLHSKEVYASVSDTLGAKEVYASPVLDTLAGIKRGILPEDLDTATQTIEYLAESTKIAIPSMAMLLSHARRHFDDAQECQCPLKRFYYPFRSPPSLPRNCSTLRIQGNGLSISAIHCHIPCKKKLFSF